MVTHYPGRLGSTEAAEATEASRQVGAGTRALEWMRQAYCGLHGHDNMLHFERDRLLLQCVSCGHQTHGWDLNQARPAVAARAEVREDARVKPVLRPHLVGERRIA